MGRRPQAPAPDRKAGDLLLLINDVPSGAGDVVTDTPSGLVSTAPITAVPPAPVLAGSRLIAADAAPIAPVCCLNSRPPHVVMIYLENHAFDTLVGYWCDSLPSGSG